MNDQELTAAARETSRRLFAAWSGDDLVRLAAGQLRELADRLDAIPQAVAEIRAMLDANAARERNAVHLDADSEARRRIREERLQIIDRLIAVEAAGDARRGPARGASRD